MAELRFTKAGRTEWRVAGYIWAMHGLPAFFLAILICCLRSMACYAQNLIPNAGFEAHTSCPDDFDRFHRVIGWQKNGLTPDYYHACAPPSVPGGVPTMGVPANATGYQAAFEGEAFAGIIVYADTPITGMPPERHREFIGVPLLQPMEPGMPYCLSFRTSATLIGADSWLNFRYLVRGIGMRFTMQPFDSIAIPPAPDNQSALYLADLPMDTTNWILVEGVYVPDSAYQYLIIGNFLDQASSTPVVMDPLALSPTAYMYVDDVRVIPHAEGCLTTSMPPVSMVPQMSVSSDAGGEWCLARFSMPLPEGCALMLHDASGRVLRTEQLPAGSTEWRLSNMSLAAGIYVVGVASPLGAWRSATWVVAR